MIRDITRFSGIELTAVSITAFLILLREYELIHLYKYVYHLVFLYDLQYLFGLQEELLR